MYEMIWVATFLVFLIFMSFSCKQKRLVPETREEIELQAILKEDYPNFVRELGKNINDPKFISLIKYLSSIRQVSYEYISIPVQELVPTQSEIGMKESLKYPLKEPSITKLYLQESGPISVAGKRIIVANKKYIIDGHHRWSQLFAINPNASINVINMINIEDPFDALKSIQLGIVAETNKLNSYNIKTFNMLTATNKEIIGYMKKTITHDVVKVFQKFNISYLDYILKNIKLLQKNNKPIENAPYRNIMPQADNNNNWMKSVPFI